MTNSHAPIPPQVYTSPPSLSTNPTREERIVDLAYRLEDLSAELIDLVTYQVTQPNQPYPRSHRRQHTTATNRFEHQAEVFQHSQARRRLECSPGGDSVTPRKRNTVTTTTLFDIKQQEEEVVEHPSPAFIKPRRAPRRAKATTNKRKSCVSRHFKHTSTNYSTKRGPNTSGLLQVSAAATKANQPLSAEHFAEGDRVQLINKEDHFKGEVGTIIKITPVQVQIKFGKYNIYRKKSNVKKLNF